MNGTSNELLNWMTHEGEIELRLANSWSYPELTNEWNASIDQLTVNIIQNEGKFAEMERKLKEMEKSLSDSLFSSDLEEKLKVAQTEATAAEQKNVQLQQEMNERQKRYQEKEIESKTMNNNYEQKVKPQF